HPGRRRRGVAGVGSVKPSARRAALGLTAVALLALGVPALTAQSADPATALSLTSTAHPPLPADLESVWISPTPSARAAGSALTRGVARPTEGRAAAALSLLPHPVTSPELRGYQQYYRALALTRAGRTDEARRAWDSLTANAA